MRKFFDNKFAFIAVFSMLTSAFAWNVMHGSSAASSGHFVVAPDVMMLLAHGPSLPPDPWDGVNVTV